MSKTPMRLDMYAADLDYLKSSGGCSKKNQSDVREKSDGTTERRPYGYCWQEDTSGNLFTSSMQA
jgi:hypothetical protein